MKGLPIEFLFNEINEALEKGVAEANKMVIKIQFLLNFCKHRIRINIPSHSVSSLSFLRIYSRLFPIHSRAS